MFRDRTNLYVSYRRTFPHRGRTAGVGGAYTDSALEGPNSAEKGGLLASSGTLGERGGSGPSDDIEMQSWNRGGTNGLNGTTDAPGAVETETILAIERSGTTLVNRIRANLRALEAKYREVILPNFDDEFNTREMRAIDDLGGHVMVEIQSLYRTITQLQQLDTTLAQGDTANPFQDDVSAANSLHATRTLVENLKRKFALQAQTLSGDFRDMQGRYVKYLKKDEGAEFRSGDVEAYSRSAMVESSKEIQKHKEDSQGETQTQLQMQNNAVSQDFLLQREREIYKISQSVVEISVIFKELENMVLDQGTVLDNVVYNLDRTSEQVQGAHKELTKASGYQKQNNKCKLVFFLVLLILFVLMLFMVRPRRVDHYVHDSPQASTGSDTQDSQDSTPNSETTEQDSAQQLERPPIEVTDPSTDEVVMPAEGEIQPIVPVDSTPHDPRADAGDAGRDLI